MYVPSNLSTDGLAAAIVFAGNGYAVIAPDYAGLGVSTGSAIAYFVASDTARAVVDMIHAVRHIHGVPSSPPLPIGFSEGGFASLAAQRALEAAGEPVLADAAVAGAYNLRTISIPFDAERHIAQRTRPTLRCGCAVTRRATAIRSNSAFTPSYAKLVPELLRHAARVSTTSSRRCRAIRASFSRRPFCDAIDGKGQHWLVDALAENEMGDWAAKAPIRLYYATDDVDVTP